MDGANLGEIWANFTSPFSSQKFINDMSWIERQRTRAWCGGCCYIVICFVVIMWQWCDLESIIINLK
jgi:hypothetical protein